MLTFVEVAKASLLNLCDKLLDKREGEVYGMIDAEVSSFNVRSRVSSKHQRT